MRLKRQLAAAHQLLDTLALPRQAPNGSRYTVPGRLTFLADRLGVPYGKEAGN